MQSEALQGGGNKRWPDFYSILESSPESDGETLRRVINKLYIKASEQSDHRELSTRFYNQVLAQKVLPQCRVILLNKSMREAYDQQWQLHRDGASSALAYPDFIHTISKDADSARALLLSNDEISILPSFGSDPAAAPLAPLQSATEPPSPTPPSPTPPSPTPPAPNAPEPPAPKKGFPVGALVAGLVVLGAVGGGLAWNASRHSTAATPPVVAPSTQRAAALAATAAPAKAPLMHLNTLAQNADFETGTLAPWVTTSTGGFVETPASGTAQSGIKVLNFWGAKSCDATVTQTIKGLKPGKYTLRAHVRRGGGQQKAEMFAQDYGGPRKVITIPFGWNWTEVIMHEVDVTGTQCTIGFTIQSEANKTANIDAVEFFRQ